MIAITDNYKKGDKIVLLEKSDRRVPGNKIVLALFNEEYVTWYYNKECDDYNWGHYFETDLQAAVKDFEERE